MVLPYSRHGDLESYVFWRTPPEDARKVWEKHRVSGHADKAVLARTLARFYKSTAAS